MTLLSWNALLFAGKFLLIGLIYFVLFMMLLAVRREMAQRIAEGATRRQPSAGRLRVIRSGSDAALKPGAILPLLPETTLGAVPGNDLVIADRYVSSHHARLRWDGVSWWVEDLNSRNGTFLNNERIPAEQPVRVERGARINLGDASLELLE
jgi:hypothetical protein